MPKPQFWHPPLGLGSQHRTPQIPILGFLGIHSLLWFFCKNIFGYFPELPVTKVRVSALTPYKNPTVVLGLSRFCSGFSRFDRDFSQFVLVVFLGPPTAPASLEPPVWKPSKKIENSSHRGQSWRFNPLTNQKHSFVQNSVCLQFGKLLARLRGRTATQRSKKGSEKSLGRVLGKGFSEGFPGRGPAMGLQ